MFEELISKFQKDYKDPKVLIRIKQIPTLEEEEEILKYLNFLFGEEAEIRVD